MKLGVYIPYFDDQTYGPLFVYVGNRSSVRTYLLPRLRSFFPFVPSVGQ